MTFKKLIIPVLVITVAGAVLFTSVGAIHAQGTGPFNGLAQAIAGKFGLSESDVQNEITAYMQTQKANRPSPTQMEKTRLDKLVSQGKITSAQETLILSELTTLQSQFNPSSLKGMTQAQRQAAMQSEKNEITTWANSNGINPTYVMPFGGRMRGGWNKPTPSPSPTP